MSLLQAASRSGRAVLHFLLRVVRVALILFMVIIPIPIQFAWMKKLVGERRNLPTETMKKRS